jgi:UDP-2,3-diacylglucosamine hydrolase
MAVFFISDVHFGHDSPEKERLKLRRLDSFFELVAEEGERLYVLGDLFDFWFEYKHTIPKDHVAVLFRLSKLIESGVKLTYVTGNHDFWLGNLLSDQLGIDIRKDELSALHNGRKILLTHGDGLSRSDRAYRIVKPVMRNRFSIFLYRQIPPDIGIPLAKWCSRLSRGHSSGRPKSSFLQEYRDYAKRRLNDGYDCVICAHTHYPEKIEYENGIYINTGDWFENYTYAMFKNDRFDLLRWDTS